MPTYLDQSLTRLKEFEGCIPWMYRDAVGRVAVGVGFVLPEAAAAQALPFTLADRPATPAEISADFKRVLQLPSSRPPAFYQSSASPELAQETIDSQLRSVISEAESGVKAKLKCYDALPDGVKLALLDMAYQLTPGGLFRDHPRMIKAVETGSWAQAAAESVRNDCTPGRNTWTRSMFLSGAILDSIRAESESLGKRLYRRFKGWLGVKS